MTSTSLEKAAVASERARIEQLIATQTSRIRRAFRQFLDIVKSDVVRSQVRRALEAGDFESAMNIIDSHVIKLGSIINRVFITSAEAEIISLAGQLKGESAAVAISFDPAYPRAAAIMRSNTLEFVRVFTISQREAARNAMEEALRSGAGPVQAARAFRDSIGLTDVQRRAVNTYRALLEAGDAAALQRDLRDRRFDRSVLRAAKEGEPLGRARIDKMVAAYRTRYLQYRAETIARTETLRAANNARHEALQQVMEQLRVPDDGVERTWYATLDSRTRDTHVVMSGQVRASGVPFQSPSGAMMMHPGDTSLGAPASEIVNCRCVLTVKLKFT